MRAWPRWALGSGLALALGCASAENRPARTPPPPAPVAGTPLPPGLALSLRVDLAALRAELGRDLAQELLRDAFAGAADADGSAEPLLERALTQSDVLWLGFPSLSQREPDKLLLLRGHFASLAPAGPQPAWARDDSGTASLELDEPGPTGYVRVYRARGDELLAWASPGTRPAVERALRAPAEQAALRPPERGTVSVAASPEPLLARYAERYPELIERLRGLRRLEAFAEPNAGAWRADLTLDFDTEEQAKAASVVAERLREAMARRACAVGALARALEISTFERNLRVQAALLGPELEAVRACVLGGGCCA